MRGQELQRAAVLHPRAALRVRRGRLRRPGGRGRPRRARRVPGRAGVRLQQLQEVRALLPRQGRLLRPGRQSPAARARGGGADGRQLVLGAARGRGQLGQLDQLGRLQLQLWPGGEGADQELPAHPPLPRGTLLRQTARRRLVIQHSGQADHGVLGPALLRGRSLPSPSPHGHCRQHQI